MVGYLRGNCAIFTDRFKHICAFGNAFASHVLSLFLKIKFVLVPDTVFFWYCYHESSKKSCYRDMICNKDKKRAGKLRKDWKRSIPTRVYTVGYWRFGRQGPPFAACA